MPSIWHSCNGTTIETENRCGCQELGVERLTIKEHEKVWGMMELFNTFIVLEVTQLYLFVKTHRTVQQK